MRKLKLIYVFRIFCAYRHSFELIENNKSSLRTFWKNWNPLVPSDAFLLSVRFVCVKEPTSPRRCVCKGTENELKSLLVLSREKKRDRKKSSRFETKIISLYVCNLYVTFTISRQRGDFLFARNFSDEEIPVCRDGEELFGLRTMWQLGIPRFHQL